MRELVARRRPDLLSAAIDAVGADPFERLDEGTAYLQPAIFCASIARLPDAAGCEPELFAGHSLGELSALVAAGALDDHDALGLVVARGRLMQRVAEGGPPGGMLAVGAGGDVAASIAAEFGLTVANDNSAEQVVLSGPLERIVAARTEAKSRGLRASTLPIKGAFHSPAMAAIVGEWRAALDATAFARPRALVFSCVTAAPFDDVRARLAESLVRGVRWREVVLALRAHGATTFVEVGPGQVLTRLVRRIAPEVDARPAVELDSVHA